MNKPCCDSHRSRVYFHYPSFSLSVLNNLSAISIPSLTGSVVCPISLVANTSAEILMKSISVIAC